jgi:hypothetical protein
VNLSDRTAQARVRAPWGDATAETFRLVDGLSNTTFERSGQEMQGEGIYVELGPWGCHFFRCESHRLPVMAAAA